MRRRDVFKALGAMALCPVCASAAKASETFFNYQANDPTHGPSHWGGVCTSGERQSPVDLSTGSIQAQLPNLAVHIGSTAGTIRDTGHTIQLDVKNGSTPETSNRLIVGGPGGVTYTMVQYHFHSPSEHLVAGKAAAMEVHFVHRHPDGGYGVLGVLLDVNPAEKPDTLTTIMQRIKHSNGAPVPYTDIDPRALMPPPAARGLYTTYRGSLTTPPCDQTVNWFVLRFHEKVSRSGFDLFNTMYPLSARPVQKLNGRPLRRNFNG